MTSDHRDTFDSNEMIVSGEPRYESDVWEIFSLLLLADRRLSDTQKIIWCCLKSFAYGGNECQISLSKLAKMIGAKDRHSVSDNLEVLVEHGFVKIVGQKGRASHYQIQRILDVYFYGGTLRVDTIIDDLYASNLGFVAKSINREFQRNRNDDSPFEVLYDLRVEHFVPIPHVLLADDRFTHGQKITWCVLKSFCLAGGACFAKMSTIAARAGGKAVSTVRGHLKALRVGGLIITEENKKRGANRHTIVPERKVYCDESGQLTEFARKMLLKNGFEHSIREKDESEDQEVFEGDFAEADESEGNVVESNNKFSDAMKQVAENEAKSKLAQQKRDKRKKAASKKVVQIERDEYEEQDGLVKEKRYTIRDIEAEWNLCVAEYFPGIESLKAKWTLPQKKNIKNICEEYGYELTIKVVQHVVKKWHRCCHQLRWNGHPNITMIIVCKDRLFPMVESGEEIVGGHKVDLESEKNADIAKVQEAWNASAAESFPEITALRVEWDADKQKTVKSLCDKFGYELTVQVVKIVISNWSTYVDRFSLNGYPSIKVVFAYADTLFAEVQAGKEVNPRSKSELARLQKEYKHGKDKPRYEFIEDELGVSGKFKRTS